MIILTKLTHSKVYFISLHIAIVSLLLILGSIYEAKIAFTISKGKQFVRSIGCAIHMRLIYKEHICEVIKLNRDVSNEISIRLDEQNKFTSELIVKGKTVFNSTTTNFFKRGETENFIKLNFNSENSEAWQIISNDVANNPLPFLKIFSTFFVHGDADGRKSNSELLDKMSLGQPVSLTCGDIAKIVNSVLKKLGIKSRIVQLTSVSSENGYDDGHIINEIYSPIHKKWVAVDMDLKLMFSDSLGTPLSIIEIYNSDWKDIEIRRFGHFSIGGINDENSFPFYFYSIHMMRDLSEWYQKKFEMIGYRSGANIAVLADKFIQQQYVLKRTGWLSMLGTEDFLETYYSIAQ